MREYTAMAASRRLLSVSSFYRIHRYTLSPPLPLSLPKPLFRNLSVSTRQPLHFPKPSPSLSLKPLFFQRHCTTSSAIESIDDGVVDTLEPTSTSASTPISSASSTSSHPWPEWVEFIGKLKSKGYLEEELLVVADDDGGDAGGVVGGEGEAGGALSVTKKELNVLRNACLTFSRERFDIYKSLSSEHIQAVVERGCPSLFRKAVNSAKRLRATLGLDEGDVCSVCNLRGSCDRAYGILKDSEASARTVDIMRMLLIYALDPLVLSGGEKPHGWEHIEESSRKLLSELSELSETVPDPALPKPAVKPPRQKEERVMGHEGSQNVEMKRGDWVCSSCNFMNFARNLRCLECKAEGPKRVRVDDVEMKKGDWNCTKCQFMNFARNTKCLRCQESRPKRELLPGEWECPSCDFLNYRRNKVCLKCNCDRPRDEVSEYEEQIWRKPH